MEYTVDMLISALSDFSRAGMGAAPVRYRGVYPPSILSQPVHSVMTNHSDGVEEILLMDFDGPFAQIE